MRKVKEILRETIHAMMEMMTCTIRNARNVNDTSINNYPQTLIVQGHDMTDKMIKT